MSFDLAALLRRLRRHRIPADRIAEIAGESIAEGANGAAGKKGPKLVAFSGPEIQALAKYAIGYPLEEASRKESAAFDSAIAKIKRRAERA